MAFSSAVAKQPSAAKEPKGRSLWADGWRRLRKNRLAMLGLFIIAFMTFLAVFAPLVAPYDPIEQLIWTKGRAAKLASPSRSTGLVQTYTARYSEPGYTGLEFPDHRRSG